LTWLSAAQRLGQGLGLAPDQAREGAGPGHHLGRHLAMGLRARRRAEAQHQHAIGLAVDDGADLRQHAVGKGLEGAALAHQPARGAHHLFQAALVRLDAAQLVEAAYRHRQAGEQAQLGQLGLGLVVVDVVAPYHLQLGGVAGLAGAQDDAQRLAAGQGAHALHQAQAGVGRLHHHVQQQHRDLGIGLDQQLGLGGRAGGQQAQRAAVDAFVAQREQRGLHDVGFVVHHQHAPAALGRGGAVQIVHDVERVVLRR